MGSLKENREINEHIEELRTQAAALSAAVKELKTSGIRQNVLLYAIQQSAKRHHTGSPIPVSRIQWILEGLEELEEYLFPEKE